MHSNNLVCELKPYIQPFERTLALKELKSISGSTPRLHPSLNETNYVVSIERPIDEILDLLTYWQAVWDLKDARHVLHTTQVRIEGAHAEIKRSRRQGRLTELTTTLPNKRELRYGPHGIHEYRGKFFPQLVGSLLNIADCPKGGLVVDLMCGSGTTVVESSIRGCTAIGIDMNPLSVLLTNTKARSIHVDAAELELATGKLLERLGGLRAASNWIATLPIIDQTYLQSWFLPETLRELDAIASAVYQEHDEAIRNIFFTVLSNIIRRVSLQKLDDLRVRRKAVHEVPEPALEAFLCELRKTTTTLGGFTKSLPRERSLGDGYAVEGDARQAATLLSKYLGTVDVIITSPPYATALPYLDTDRLSLSFLDLLPRSEHRDRDFTMIGNRELKTTLAKEYWQSYKMHGSLLPREVRKMIDHLMEVNSLDGVGFRRRNLPYLLAKYFLDMHAVINQMFELLKPGGYSFIVVGNNSTSAAGQIVDIRTDDWLGDMAKSIGFCVREKLPMDMLVSRDIFRENAIARETILFLQKPLA